MNFFPTKKYTFSLIDTDDKSIERLKRRTYNSDSLISKTTDKSFIGIINVNDFKVISSERGIGTFCVLDGEIKNQKGEIDIYINKPFKYLFSIILLFPLIALIGISVTEGISLSILFLCLLQFAFIRFAFIGLFFYILSKRSVNKLADVLDTNAISLV